MTIYDDKPWLNHYDNEVSHEIPEPSMNYLEYLERGIDFSPTNAVCHFLGSTYSFGDLDDYSKRIANYLIKNGCKKGDVIGINLPNTPQYMFAIAGAVRAGCIISGVSPLLTPKELIHQINDSGARFFLTLDILFETNFLKIKDKVPGCEHVIVTNIADFISPVKRVLGKLLKKIPSGKVKDIEGKKVISFKKILAEYPPEKPYIKTEMDDVFLLQYTGGTTGPSKGTILTHKNMMYNICQIIQWVDSETSADEDILNVPMGKEIISSGFPFFHMAGLAICLQHLCLSNPHVLVPDPRNTTSICKDLMKYKATAIVNVPTLYQMLLENPDFKKIDFSELKYAISGAAPFDVASIHALEEVIGKGKVIEVYGMSETSPIITMNPLENINKIGSVGLPVQNTNIKIMDVQDGTKEVPVGEPGELIVNGPQVMEGYHNKPEATKDTLRMFKGEEWLYTGDVAKMDEDGYIYIVDRTKDMLLVGGFNVYSKELEETLYEIDQIELCAIVGEPNPERPGSELVKAVIQLSDAFKNSATVEEEIISYCRENMAPYKVPKIIEFIDEMPLTAVGKIDKKVLR